MKKNLRARVAVPALSLVALACGAAWGQSASDKEFLDPIVVTATRDAQPLSEVLSSVTVITREEIERSQAVDISDLFRGQPGFEMSRYGGIGTQPSFFLRGQDSNSLVIYVDGVRVQTDGIGSIQSGTLPDPQLIDHIEILRGNASALYGEAATGGVIDIHTRTGGNGAPKVFAASTIGSQNTVEASAGIGGRVNETKFNVTISDMSTNGIPPLNASQALVTNGVVSNANAGASQAKSMSASISREFEHGLEIGLRDAYSYSNVLYDDGSSPTNYSQYVYSKNDASIFGKYKVSADWVSRVELTNASFSTTNTENSTVVWCYPSCNYNQTSSTNLIKWTNTYKVSAKQNVVFGADYSSQNFNDGVGDQMLRSSSAAYAGYTHRLNAFEFQGNLRHDGLSVNQPNMNSGSKDYSMNTGLLGVGYWVNDQLKLNASTTSGFRAPAVQELFGNPSWFIGPNFNLQPQVTYSQEIGLDYSNQWSSWRAARFNSRTTNHIDCTSTECVNDALVSNQGWEFSNRVNVSGFKVVAAYTLQNPINDSTGQQLSLRAKNFGSIDVDKAFGENEKYDVGTKVIQSGVRTSGSETLSAYQLWSFYAGMKLNDEFKVRLRIDNAFNENYQLVYGYNTPGTTAWLTLIYQEK